MSADPLDLLLERLGRGDSGAAEQIMREYEPYLRMVVRRYLPSGLRRKFDSVDVVQSVWVHVWKGLRGVSWQFSDREHLRALLVTVTRRRLVSRFRHYRASLAREDSSAAGELDHMPAAPGPGPEDLVRANELWERVLSLCPADQHELLRLRRQGFTMDEIAERTGMHEGSVRRVFRRLARRLALEEQPAAPPREKAL
jgi:RNA polymerase sigma-70 factor (ECF subfamily)